MGLLALLVGVPMVVARVVLEREGTPELLYGIEGVLEGLVAVPWLLIGFLVHLNAGPGWPFLALTVMLVPRALCVGWALGAGERLEATGVSYAGLRVGALFLAATVIMSVSLGFLGVGLPPDQVGLGNMLGQSRAYLQIASWTVIFPGLFIGLVAAIWLVVATLCSRSGREYREVGWAHTMS